MATPTPDLNAIAAEICGMWHDYLQNLAKDGTGRAELLRLMEPQLKMMQAWPRETMDPWSPAAMKTAQDFARSFQNGEQAVEPNHDAETPRPPEQAERPDHAASTIPPDAAGSDGLSPATAAPSDDCTLRLAQLALRVATLEERFLRLEARQNRRPRKNSGAGED